MRLQCILTFNEEKKMTIETTYILKADEGKMLRNKIDGIETPSVWLKIGDNKDDWEEVELPQEIDAPPEEVQEEQQHYGGEQ